MDISTAPNGVGGNTAVVASLNALKMARDAPREAALELIESVAEPAMFDTDGRRKGPSFVGQQLDAKA